MGRKATTCPIFHRITLMRRKGKIKLIKKQSNNSVLVLKKSLVKKRSFSDIGDFKPIVPVKEAAFTNTFQKTVNGINYKFRFPSTIIEKSFTNAFKSEK